VEEKAVAEEAVAAAALQLAQLCERVDCEERVAAVPSRSVSCIGNKEKEANSSAGTTHLVHRVDLGAHTLLVELPPLAAERLVRKADEPQRAEQQQHPEDDARESDRQHKRNIPPRPVGLAVHVRPRDDGGLAPAARRRERRKPIPLQPERSHVRLSPRSSSTRADGARRRPAPALSPP